MTTDEVLAILEDLKRFSTDHQHVEVKAAASGLPRRLWETISAFANTAGGGALILGVAEEEDFAVVGVHDPKKSSQDLASICDEMMPPVRALIELHEIEGEPVLVAEIPEASLEEKPCYYSGAGLTNGAFVRVADGDRRLNQYEVQVMRASRGQPQEDREPVPDAGVTALHGDLTEALLNRLRSDRPFFQGRSDPELLKMTGVVVEYDGRDVLTLGGLLALGTAPQQFFPELSLTFVAYPTPRVGEAGPRGERFLDEARIDGPIPLMIEPTLRVLQRNMKRRAVICVFRPKSATESGASRPPIPAESGHLFRRDAGHPFRACRPPIPGMPATHSGHVGHPFRRNPATPVERVRRWMT